MHYNNRYVHCYSTYLFLQTNKYMQIRNIDLHVLMNKISYLNSLYTHGIATYHLHLHPYNTPVRINLQPHNKCLLHSHNICYIHTHKYTQKIQHIEMDTPDRLLIILSPCSHIQWPAFNVSSPAFAPHARVRSLGCLFFFNETSASPLPSRPRPTRDSFPSRG
jgi:hypothetical protein